ncbi:hypothetical protein O3P69_000495 [Scylla paramamosain]|uniref:Uncharacterized protein n=1 Tax=Scylla paramamosain TaxID=85552 RepID=A0AAW0UW92_SCYPA
MKEELFSSAKPPMPALYRSRQEYERRSRTLAASGLGPQRTVKQIKKIWENMRSRAKKFVSDQKKKTVSNRRWSSKSSRQARPCIGENPCSHHADELELDPNHNDSDRWPTDVTVVVIINEKGEQLDEPMAMTEQPSTACSVPILLMPTRGNDSAPAACTSFVESSGTAALLYSPAIHSTPLPLTSKDVRGTVVVCSVASLRLLRPPVRYGGVRGKEVVFLGLPLTGQLTPLDVSMAVVRQERTQAK